MGRERRCNLRPRLSLVRVVRLGRLRLRRLVPAVGAGFALESRLAGFFFHPKGVSVEFYVPRDGRVYFFSFALSPRFAGALERLNPTAWGFVIEQVERGVERMKDAVE